MALHYEVEVVGLDGSWSGHVRDSLNPAFPAAWEKQEEAIDWVNQAILELPEDKRYPIPFRVVEVEEVRRVPLGLVTA